MKFKSYTSAKGVYKLGVSLQLCGGLYVCAVVWDDIVVALGRPYALQARVLRLVRMIELTKGALLDNI